MISPWRHHAVTYHPARHDLSLPAAGRLWRAPNDAPSTRLPRSKGDRGEPRDQPGAEEPAFRSGRIRQSCGDRAVFGSRKRAVLREHRAPRAFAVGHRGPRSRGCRKDLSGRLWRRRDAGPRLLHRTPSTRSGERGFINSCPPVGRSALSSFSPGFTGHQSRLHYRRREAKGIQLPVETLRLGHGSCRDFAMLMIEAARSLGFAARFASGYLVVPLDDPKELTSGSVRGSTHAWAQIYLPGTGWVDFDPTSGSIGKIGLVTVAVVCDTRHAIPLHGTFIGFPSDHLGMEVQVSVTSGTPEAIWATPQRSTWPQFHQSV